MSQPSEHSKRDAKPSLKLKHIWREELLAGFQVALIALPLSLGIAVASGFPAMAGIVAAVVGGLFVSRISGTHVTINGPAAGLIVVILAGVQRLGHGDPVRGYQLTLAAIVCAGLLQILFGVLRAGRLSTVFPNAAVHGMMCAIGIIVVGKQLPVLLGADAKGWSVLAIFTHLGDLVERANPLVAGTGLVGAVALVALPAFKGRLFKLLPPPIWVVAIGALIGWFARVEHFDTYQLWGETHHLGAELYLRLPQNIFASLGRPDFSGALSPEFVVTVLAIALVASLETLLSAAAVDKMDPLQRKSDLNRDLIAVGAGTALSGLLGGLPMIAEIVRSKANVVSGARTGWSNFFHGTLILLVVLILPWFLTSIPLTSLAALLVYTGCRLASPKQLQHMAAIGFDQAMVFTVTVVMVLATDLLIGIAAGLVTEVALHLIRRVPLGDLLRCRFSIQETSDTVEIGVRSCVIFSNVLRLATAIERALASKRIVINLAEAPFIDHTAWSRLHALKADVTARGGVLEIVESAQHQPVSKHLMAARRLKA